MFFELSVYRDRTRLYTVGESSENGFRVDIRHRRLSIRAKEQLPGFRKESPTPAVMLLSFAAYLIGIGLWISCYFALLGGAGALPLVAWLSWHAGLLAGGLAAGVLCSIIPRGLLGSKTLWQWHACEHKAILMVRQGCEPTMENLRRMPAATPSCGSVRLFLMCTLMMAFSLFGAFPIGARLAAASIGSAVMCTLFLAGTGQRSWGFSSRLVYSMGLPALLAAVTFEWLIVLRAPTEEQLDQTLDFLHLLYWRHPWLASPKLRRTPTLRMILGHE